MKRLILLAISTIFLSLLQSSLFACTSVFTYNRACTGDTVWFHPNDPSAVYCWTFGDSLSVSNVSFDQQPYHVYTTPGTYYVSLFTNIGAEWDYYTAAVVVGTDCFDADFTADCNGSLSVQFSDFSVGEHLSYLWYFGDPASGVSDTSGLKNPAHTYSSAGAYTVSLIIHDGINADTTFKTIMVSDVCLGAIFGQQLVLPCWGDTFAPWVTYYGSVTSYFWDFGDPASGIYDTSSLAHAGHIYWSPGIYTITLIVSDGANSDTTRLNVEVVDCRLWPGDVNKDGEVNMDDLFGIGIYYGNTGLQRPSATTAFTPQESADWSGFQNYMYLQDFLNAKHADCNGDGVINSNDFNVVMANYGQHSNHNNNRSAMLNVQTTNAELGFLNDSIDAVSGSTLMVGLNLGIDDAAHSVYGYSCRIHYDNTVFSWASADFFTSWLGYGNPNIYNTFYDNSSEGWIDVAGILNTHTTLSGKGEVAILYLHPAWGGTSVSDLSVDGTAKVISNGMSAAQHNQMVVIPVELRNLKVKMFGGINEYNLPPCRIYPNPTEDLINLSFDREAPEQIDIFNAMGILIRTIKPENSNISIPVSQWLPGLYYGRAVSGNEVWHFSFVRR
jgi:PKD repeat protein